MRMGDTHEECTTPELMAGGRGRRSLQEGAPSGEKYLDQQMFYPFLIFPPTKSPWNSPCLPLQSLLTHFFA